MKVDREKIKEKVQDIIANGVVNGEEIDITTKKIMEEINPLILATEER